MNNPARAGLFVFTLTIGGRSCLRCSPSGLAGSDGPCSFLYRHSGPGIGLCLAKQVLERQPKKKVNLAISNDLIEHPERPPDSHSCPPGSGRESDAGSTNQSCWSLKENGLQNLSLGGAVSSSRQPQGNGQLKEHSANRIDKHIMKGWAA